MRQTAQSPARPAGRSETRSPRGAAAGAALAAPAAAWDRRSRPGDNVGDDEGDAEGDQHLALLVAREAAENEPLHHDAEQSDAEPADDRRQPEMQLELQQRVAE